jgi:hypothetical protein
MADKMKCNGQFSAEFMITLIVLFLFLLLSTFAWSERQSSFNAFQESTAANALASHLARNINAVHFSGEGTATTIFLDSKGFEFDITANQNAVEVFFSNGFADASLVSKNVAFNHIEAGDFVKIENINGMVIVSAVE